MAKMTREELIAICEAASVPQSKWTNRDSYEAQFQVGECWALLRAGCEFHVHGATDDPCSNANTIWVTTYGEGFAFFDYGGERDEELHYLPTRARLEKADGGDWY